MTQNPAGALSAVVKQMRERADESRFTPWAVAAVDLRAWADRLESLSRAGDGPGVLPELPCVVALRQVLALFSQRVPKNGNIVAITDLERNAAWRWVTDHADTMLLEVTAFELAGYYGSQLAAELRAESEALRRALAERVPEGWRLVPVEPTPEMCRAGGFHEWSGGFDRNGSHSAGEYVEYTHSLEHAFGTYGCESAAAEVWAAMLAAAPTPPQEGK